ncbi:hypothetical protein GCM10027592_58530 [Spirosoma flavus]
MKQEFGRNLLFHVTVIIIVSILFGCDSTKSAHIEDAGRIQRVTVKNPRQRGVEIPVTIRISGDIDGDAYVYLEGRPEAIRPRVPGGVWDIFGKGRFSQVIKHQVGPKQDLTFVYVPVSTTKGHLTIDVEYTMGWFY